MLDNEEILIPEEEQRPYCNDVCRTAKLREASASSRFFVLEVNDPQLTHYKRDFHFDVEESRLGNVRGCEVSLAHYRAMSRVPSALQPSM